MQKHIVVEEKYHNQLKLRATKKRRSMKEELTEILKKELDSELNEV